MGKVRFVEEPQLFRCSIDCGGGLLIEGGPPEGTATGPRKVKAPLVVIAKDRDIVGNAVSGQQAFYMKYRDVIGENEAFEASLKQKSISKPGKGYRISFPNGGLFIDSKADQKPFQMVRMKIELRCQPPHPPDAKTKGSIYIQNTGRNGVRSVARGSCERARGGAYVHGYRNLQRSHQSHGSQHSPHEEGGERER